jgi:hypothetical protein
LPGVYVNVPTNLTEHWAAMAYIWFIQARVFVQRLLGTAVPLIIPFAGLCLIFFLLRGQKYARRIAFVAVLGTLLAAVDLSFSHVTAAGYFLNFGPAELFGVYGAVLVLLLSLRYSFGSRVLAGTGAAVVVVTEMAVGYHWLGSDWLNHHSDLIYIPFAVLAFGLLVSVVIASCSTARHVMAGESHASEKGESHASEKRDGVRGRVVFWTGSALVAALAYSMGNLQAVTLGNHQSVTLKSYATLTEFSTLRYALVFFAVPLIAIALVIPLVSHDLSKGQDLSKGKADAGRDSKPKSWWRGEPGRFVAAAAFGWATVAQLPYLYFAVFPLPAAQFLLAIIVYATVKRKPPTPVFSRPLSSRQLSDPELLAACQPQRGPKGNAILAAKISGALAIFPIGYFIYAAAPLWPAEIQQPGLGSVLVAASVLRQLTGWILTGVIFAALSPRLPGRVGPMRAFYLTAAWFAAALTVQIINYWTGHAAGWAWSLPGLLLLIFLVTFSVAWDAYILNPRLGWGTWMATLSKVAKTYNVERTGAIIRYAVPVLAALVGVGQILASGNAGEFVKGLLKLAGTLGGPGH